jgi:hypothetical protein
MALPKSIETERTLYLQNLVNSSPDKIINWPVPTRDDHVLVGRLVILYGYIDFDLRRMIEVLDHAKNLPAKWAGKSAQMSIGDVEATLETMPDASPANALAFGRIREFRKLRNLVAHFAIKRFPNEDALVFMTKSASDYKRVLGEKPHPGVVMAGYMDLPQARNVCGELERLVSWLCQATHDLENRFLESRKAG